MASGAWIRCRTCLRVLLTILAAGAMGIVLRPTPAFAIEYSAETIEARVVDAQSGAPLEGVIVVAHWQLEGGLEGGNVLGQVNVLETITDASGGFKFPAWGPVPIPRGLPANARLKDLDPEMVLFKPGYKFVHLQNTKTFEQTRGFGSVVRTSDWNHKTIKMNALFGDTDEMAKELWGLESSLRFGTNRFSSCAWASMTEMIKAADRYRADLAPRLGALPGRSTYKYLITNDEHVVKLGCASPKQLFGESPR